YWMTGAFIAAKSAPAREKILENLLEEVRDSHPNMMRKFAIAAGAVPTDRDAAVVFEPLTAVRLFIGRLSPVPILTTMAFFEGFIQRFMPYLADLAARQGSTEMEYTDVHGVCDVTHTEELYKALGTEVELSNGAAAKDDLFEGVRLLRSLIETIVVA
ncbi:MAG TPA: iron-containing redox enzyme family protein, partial [Vicinamibacterales bacterium]|nr:iron-containing redox enzyme family protein [Vicinamibacterales bacterium]